MIPGAGDSKYWLPEDISTHGAELDQLNNVIHWFMLLLFVGWGIFFVYCLIRFHRKSNPKAQHEMIKAKPSKYAEIAVVLFEVLLLVGFSMPVWAKTKNDFPKAEDNPLTVRVIAQQFAWNFHYAGDDGIFGPTDPNLVDEAENPIGIDRSHPAGADDIVSINNLVIPVNRPVIARITSKDVIHSFWLPVVRVKQDTIPGQEIPVWFETTKTGEWDVACAQLCGLNHYSMRGYLRVVTPEAYDEWMEEEKEYLGDDEDDF